MHEKLHHVLSRLYPLSLTSQGDNTGLLIPHLHTPAPTARKQKYLLTIDLTSQNITELTQNGETIAGVIAYHPPIYHAIKKIERGVVMECIQVNGTLQGIRMKRSGLIRKRIEEYSSLFTTHSSRCCRRRNERLAHQSIPKRNSGTDIRIHSRSIAGRT